VPNIEGQRGHADPDASMGSATRPPVTDRGETAKLLRSRTCGEAVLFRKDR
jgi:hypothetical protein